MNMLVRSTATVAAATLVPSTLANAAIDNLDAELLRLETEIIALEDGELKEAHAAFAKCEDIVFDWKQENPRPQLPDRPIVVGEVVDDVITITTPTAASIRREIAAPAHKRAVRLWNRRRCWKERTCGYRAAERHRDSCTDRLLGLIETMMGIQARTIAGLQAKARVASELGDGDLIENVANDVLKMGPPRARGAGRGAGGA